MLSQLDVAALPERRGVACLQGCTLRVNIYAKCAGVHADWFQSDRRCPSSSLGGEVALHRSCNLRIRCWGPDLCLPLRQTPSLDAGLCGAGVCGCANPRDWPASAGRGTSFQGTLLRVVECPGAVLTQLTYVRCAQYLVLAPLRVNGCLGAFELTRQ